MAHNAEHVVNVIDDGRGAYRASRLVAEQEEVALYLERAEAYLVGIAGELRAATAAYAAGALDEWMRRKQWGAEQLRLVAFVMESLARRVASC